MGGKMIKVGDKVWEIAPFWKDMNREQRNIGVPFVYCYRYPNWQVIPVKRTITGKDKSFFFYGGCDLFRIKKNCCFKRLSDAKKAVKIMNKKDRRKFINDVVRCLESKMV